MFLLNYEHTHITPLRGVHVWNRFSDRIKLQIRIFRTFCALDLVNFLTVVTNIKEELLKLLWPISLFCYPSDFKKNYFEESQDCLDIFLEKKVSTQYVKREQCALKTFFLVFIFRNLKLKVSKFQSSFLPKYEPKIHL